MDHTAPPVQDHPSRQLLVLDLDETLVHATPHALSRPADLFIAGYHVYKRPHVDAFLDFAFAHFRVGVWTSSHRLYAEPLVAALMPARRLDFVWASERCSLARDRDTGRHGWQKRFAKLKRRGYRLAEVIGVDDTPSKYSRNYGNLVQVSEYQGDLADDELLHLSAYLRWLARQPDVRRIEKRCWRLR